MPAHTLADGLKSSSVNWETLQQNYNPLLGLVRELIGVVPNCDPILEIWPPGFRSYNLLVPNMFNLPSTIFGNKSFKASMGLAMYASSKAACAYCTAHTCSFALRRGVRKEAIAGSRTAKEQAVVTMAEKLASVPSLLTMTDVENVRQHFSPSETEWLIYAVSMMGFLNKFMNAVGVELEQDAINDTAELLVETGWEPGIHALNGFSVTNQRVPHPDNLLTYLRVIRQAPGAVRWEKKWMATVPSDYPAASKYLEQHAGYSFPIFKPVKEKRVIRTLTTVLRDNLNKELTVIGLKIKIYGGYIFSTMVGNIMLKTEIKNLSVHWAPEITDQKWDLLNEISKMDVPASNASCEEVIASFQQQLSLTRQEAAAILLVISASYSPAQNNDAVTEAALKYMEPAGIVENIVWLSVLQLLNRLSSYYMLIQAY